MAQPYIKEFDLGYMKLTSVVLDQEEFDRFVESFRSVFPNLTDADIESAKNRRVVFLQRGTKTQPLFERYGVKTDSMGVIVRGSGPEVFRRMMGQ